MGGAGEVVEVGGVVGVGRVGAEVGIMPKAIGSGVVTVAEVVAAI